MIVAKYASMALYVTVLGLVGGTPGGETPRRNLLVSNKPLDNRSIAPQATHESTCLRVIGTAAVRDLFRLIDSDRDRYLATGSPVHCCIALSVGDASLHNSQIVDRS